MGGCSDYFQNVLFFGIIGFITNAIGYRKKFYTLPCDTAKTSLTILKVLGSFAIYFVIFLPVSQVCFETALLFLNDRIPSFALTQIVRTALCFFFFGSFLVFSVKRQIKSFGKTPSSFPRRLYPATV